MKITTDHDEIREWVKRFKGRPEILNNIGSHTNDVGLRIDFPGTMDDMYLSEDHPPEDTSWTNFFKIFEEQELAFEYDEKEAITDPSSAFHFIRRDNVLEEE